MKKSLLIVFFAFCCSSALFSQAKQQIDSLMITGIKHHDKGEYEKALNFYMQALKLDPVSDVVNYEIAYTYFEMKNYEEAIKYSDKVLEGKGKSSILASVVKGSALNYMDKSQEAIEIFQNATKTLGEHYLLYFNQAVVHHKLKEYEEENDILIKALSHNNSHSSSHLQLAYCKNAQGKKAQTLLCLYYFLFLEQNTQRSKNAYELLQSIYTDSVQKNKDKPDNFNIIFDPDLLDSEYKGIEIIIPILQALRHEDINKDKSEEEFFVEITRSIFNSFGENKTEDNNGLWWDFYVPFFYELVQNKHVDTFCYYICHGINPKAREWLDSNPDKLESFSNWYNLNKTSFGMY